MVKGHAVCRSAGPCDKRHVHSARRFATTHSVGPSWKGVDRQGAVAVVTLRRRPANAMDIALLLGIAEVFERLGEDQSVRAAVLTSDGRVLLRRMRMRRAAAGAIGTIRNSRNWIGVSPAGISDR